MTAWRCAEAGNDWRESSASHANGNCVEAASGARAILVRDTADRDGTVLSFTAGGVGEVHGQYRGREPVSGTAEGADAVVEHLAECTDAKAAIVVDGSADDVIAQMTAAGWTLDERVDHVAGKRVRFLRAPRATGADL